MSKPLMIDARQRDIEIEALKAQLAKARYDALTEAATRLNQIAESVLGTGVTSAAALTVLRMRDE